MGGFLKTTVQILSTLGETLALLKSGTSMCQDTTSAFYLCLRMHVYLSACLSLLPGALFIKLIILCFFSSLWEVLFNHVLISVSLTGFFPSG